MYVLLRTFFQNNVAFFVSTAYDDIKNKIGYCELSIDLGIPCRIFKLNTKICETRAMKLEYCLFNYHSVNLVLFAC